MACRADSPLHVIQYLLRRWPESIQIRNASYLAGIPLHLACDEGAPLNVIQFLVEQWPESLQCKAQEASRTPLHLACFNFARNSKVSSSFEEGAIQYLVRADPEAAKEEDSFGRLPVELIFGGTRDNYLELVQCLVEAHPSSVQRTNDDGETLLHIACATKAPVEVVEYLLNQWPQASEVANNKGELPLHLACAPGREPFGTTSAPLETFDRPVVAIQKVLNAFRDGCTMGTYNTENLPLHLACEAGLSIETIMMIALANRDTIKSVNSKGELPLHKACEYAHGSMELARYLTITGESRGESLGDGHASVDESSPHAFPSSSHLRGPLHSSQGRVHNIKNFEVIKYLVDLWPGALSCRNAEGKTPSEITSLKAIANLHDIQINEQDYLPIRTTTTSNPAMTDSKQAATSIQPALTAAVPTKTSAVQQQHALTTLAAQHHDNYRTSPMGTSTTSGTAGPEGESDLSADFGLFGPAEESLDRLAAQHMDDSMKQSPQSVPVSPSVQPELVHLTPGSMGRESITSRDSLYERSLPDTAVVPPALVVDEEGEDETPIAKHPTEAVSSNA